MGRDWWGFFCEYGCDPMMPQDLLLRLELTRTSVLEDTFEKLAAVDHSDYKRPLVVNM